MSTVNIVMAAYNGEKYIREQIDSILASSYTDWSLIVFDDCSSDATPQIVMEYVEKYPERIRLFSNESNKGSCRTFLEGLQLLFKASSGVIDESSNVGSLPSNRAKYFMFADQDDVWLKDKIEKTMSHMLSLEKRYGKDVPLLVYTDAVVVDDKLHFQNNSFRCMSKLNCRKNDLAHILMENKCMGCTCMLNSALAELITDLPEGIKVHDWWVALTAATFGHICPIDYNSMLYRQHGCNQIGSSDFRSYAKSRVKAPKGTRAGLMRNFEQAKAFLSVYGDKIPSEKLWIIKCFSEIPNKGFFERRRLLLKYGFLKSGFLRNVGLFLII